MFANLSQGSLVYLLNLKGDNIKYSTGSIETVSYMSPFQQPYGVQNSSSYLTLRVNTEGKSTTIEGVPSNSVVAKTNDYIVTDTIDAMISQIKILLNESTNIVNNVDKYKNNIIEYRSILKQISPEYAQQSSRDEAISTLNTRVNTLDDKLDKILTTLAANNNSNNKIE